MSETPLEQGNHGIQPAIDMLQLPGFQIDTASPAGFTDQTDATGRPLAEFRAPGEVKAASLVPLIERKSRLVGSRLGFMENISALHAIFRDDPKRALAAQNAIVWFRNTYSKAHPDVVMHAGNIHEIASLATAATIFAIYRACGYGPHNALPTYYADALKIYQGIYSATLSMEGTTGPSPIKPTDIYQHAETERLLITPDGQACPAPKPMIDYISRLIIQGSTADKTGRINGDESELTREFPTLADFGILEAFATDIQEYATTVDALHEEIYSAVATNDLHTLSPEQRAQVDGILLRYSGIMQNIQVRVNTHLGRSITDVPAVTPEALARNARLEI